MKAAARFLVVVFVLAAPLLMVEVAVEMGIAASRRPPRTPPNAPPLPAPTPPAVRANPPVNVNCGGPACQLQPLPAPSHRR